MPDDEIERLLRDALDAQARASVGDHATPPPPRFLTGDDTLHPATVAHPGRRRRALAPLAAAAAVVAIAGGVLGISKIATSGDDGSHRQVGQRPGITASPVPSAKASVDTSGRAARSVHVKLLNSDGLQYGVGMPVIAYFSERITDGRALQRATTVTVDGKPEPAAWYFEPSAAGKGPVEGHLRLQNYWPAHAKVHVAMAVQGRSAGAGLVFDNSLTLDFRTGAALISVVNANTHELTVTRDGTEVGKYPVSLGATNTPTSHGTKVIMEKGASICMSGPGYHECGIKYTQRLTYDGEYLHAAPWNVKNIRDAQNTSNGCTNLLPADARKLYSMFEVGDVVKYPNADGRAMTLGAGYGDWNVDWGTWRTGGLVRTR